MSLPLSLPAASGGVGHGLVAASSTSDTEGAIVSLFLTRSVLAVRHPC